MKTILLMILSLFSVFVNAQEYVGVTLKNTDQFELESDLFVGEPFTIQVCLPKGFNNYITRTVVVNYHSSPGRSMHPALNKV